MYRLKESSKDLDVFETLLEREALEEWGIQWSHDISPTGWPVIYEVGVAVYIVQTIQMGEFVISEQRFISVGAHDGFT